MEDHLVGVKVNLAAAASAASFSSLSVNHFSRQRSQGMSDCRLAGKITKSAFCLVFTCHCNCSMLGLSFIIVIPHLGIPQFHL